jgi:hypothetical protein
MYHKFQITIILPVFNLQSSNFGFLERIKWLSSTLLEVDLSIITIELIERILSKNHLLIPD